MTSSTAARGTDQNADGSAAGRRIAEGIVAACREHGVRHAFGVPGGGTNLDVVGMCGVAGIDFVLTHTETAGALMASVIAELTGNPGLCLATRGPGAASLVNGAAHALLDRVPMLLVTDGIAHGSRDTTPHQRIDHSAMFAPVVKASIEVGADRTVDVVREALALAAAPPSGPVHLDVVPDTAPHEPPASPRAPAEPEPLSQAARALLDGCHRPLFAVGLGARAVFLRIRELATERDIPVLATYKAKGVVDERSAIFAGLLTGAAAERAALNACDLVIALGLDPVELIPNPWPYPAPVLSLTPWPITDGTIPAAEQVAGPLAPMLDVLEPSLAGKGWMPPGEARAAIRALAEDPALTPAAVVTDARQQLPPETIATVDAGAHMLIAMELWLADRPTRTFSSSGLATMGYALPAAIGAVLAAPGTPVVCFTGDGGLGMCAAELEILGRRHLPVCVVVFNDSALSLIEVKQGVGQGGPAAVRYRETDFAAVAAAMGVPGIRVTTRDQLRTALRGHRSQPGPLLVDVAISGGQYRDIMRLIRGV